MGMNSAPNPKPTMATFTFRLLIVSGSYENTRQPNQRDIGHGDAANDNLPAKNCQGKVPNQSSRNVFVSLVSKPSNAKWRRRKRSEPGDSENSNGHLGGVGWKTSFRLKYSSRIPFTERR
jgi:hypothetical protein